MRVLHVTVWPSVRFARSGAWTGPPMITTGRVSKFPALNRTDAPGGSPGSRVNGTVNGTTIPPPSGGGVRPSVSVFCTVPYLRGSGATRPAVNATSARVG